MEKAKNTLRSKIDSESAIYRAYHYLLKSKDHLNYVLSEKRENLKIVLTFDEPPDDVSIRIPKFLNNENIKATFFIPPANAKDSLIEETVSLCHEIGGHGWDHSQEEIDDEHRRSALKCFKYLKKFYPNVISWRFPGLAVKSKRAYENVKKAGFRLDSTRGTYYPISSTSRYNSLEECPFLRLPPSGQMDINTKIYDSMSRFILKVCSSWRGIIVLPFHTWYQNQNFEKFKKLIKGLKRDKVEFKRLIDIRASSRKK